MVVPPAFVALAVHSASPESARQGSGPDLAADRLQRLGRRRMSRQFKQAVAWWLRAKGLQVKEVLDVVVNDTRGCSELTGPYGSLDVVVTYLDDKGKRNKYWEECDFAAF